jgi:hypothetical protein
VPGVGQACVDHVASRAGLVPSKFLGSVDHPRGDRLNRPDFLIRCQDDDVRFEHKLDSPLGRRQLERELTLYQTRGQKRALVAARALPLEASICDSPCFVRPREAGAPAHFLWQDVHHIVQSFPDRIARDFAEFLEASGLAHFDGAGLGDPFTSDEAARELRSLYDTLAPPDPRTGSVVSQDSQQPDLPDSQAISARASDQCGSVGVGCRVGSQGLGTCDGTVGLGSTTRRWHPMSAPAGPRLHTRFLTSHLG